MEIGARNQIRGRVKSIVKGAVMAEVQVEIVAAGITAAITAASVDRLALRENDEVVVIVKASEVMIGK